MTHKEKAKRLIEGIDDDIDSAYHDVGSLRELIHAMLREISNLTSREHPKRCLCCGEVREASELEACGQCGCNLEGPCE